MEVHIEVCLNPKTSVDYAFIKKKIVQRIVERSTVQQGPFDLQHDKVLEEHVQKAYISFDEHAMHKNNPQHGHNSSGSDVSGYKKMEVLTWQANFRIHVYQNHDAKYLEDPMQGEEECITACNVWILPNLEYDGIWESLMFDHEIKHKLIKYSSSAMLFSKMGVDRTLINWNRIILLHGPPGTGKTSICKALAQKLSIRLSDQYSSCQLLEINAHSLFSKWFSESGKLVARLFHRIQTIASDPDCLVMVLIDEVESLTAARKSAVSGSEPSDALRVVNALLTQLDGLKSLPNVMILTTSNITSAIDEAFLDRADLKQYIGPPSKLVRLQILLSCIQELEKRGIVGRDADDNVSMNPMISPQGNAAFIHTHCNAAHGPVESAQLVEVQHRNGGPYSSTVMQLLDQAVDACDGWSGRAIRKLPMIAHIQCTMDKDISPRMFLQAMISACEQDIQDQPIKQVERVY